MIIVLCFSDHFLPDLSEAYQKKSQRRRRAEQNISFRRKFNNSFSFDQKESKIKKKKKISLI